MGCLITAFGLFCLAIGLGSVAILIKIGGQSDGPGALFFYIGAVGGLYLAWASLMPSRSPQEEVETDDGPQAEGALDRLAYAASKLRQWWWRAALVSFALALVFGVLARLLRG